jgi:hypothetical protein
MFSYGRWEPITADIICCGANYNTDITDIHQFVLKLHHTKDFQIKIGLNELYILGHKSSVQHKKFDKVWFWFK